MKSVTTQINHRVEEASALRRLFQEQWDRLMLIKEEWEQRKLDERLQTEKLSDAIETMVDGTDARLRAIGSYRNRLRAGVRKLLEYVESQVQSLPPAIEMTPQSFASNPLVNSLFVNNDDLQQLFSRCKALRRFFDDMENRSCEEAYALLFVSKCEKTVFGKSLQGDMVTSDVIQTAVNFSDHQVMNPAADEQAVRKSLEILLFNSIVDYIKLSMTRRIHQQQEPSGNSTSLSPVASLKNPQVYLKSLIDCLDSPRQCLQQQESTLKISKMGIMVDEGEDSNANEFSLNALRVGDFESRIISLVRYPKSEMKQYERENWSKLRNP